MITIRLQGRSSNLTMTQIYAPTTDVDKSIIGKFYMDQQQLLDDIAKKDAIQIIDGWNAKVSEAELPEIGDKFGLGKRNEAGERLIEFCQDNWMVVANMYVEQPKQR